jgi:membrane associated rhomboid family serine protease
MLILPISDENPTLRFPVVTVLLLATMGAVWVLVQGAGLDANSLAASVCNLGLVPGELTHRARIGTAVPIGPHLACIVDNDQINILTPLTSMFLHGSWSHILGNGLFLWIFGNNVEDSMGRFRYLLFYLLCGLAAAAAQVFMNPASPVPMVGASGAISGVLGAYLLLYPKVRVKIFLWIIIIFRTFYVPAYLVLLIWIGLQVLDALPQLSPVSPDVSAGVAVFAHIGGFAAGVILVNLFVNRGLVGSRTDQRHRLYPGHP